jgi:N-acetylglucosaminyldiphosphoundecaprenol N-acetyl-beta-D-mannosaminyltransferase
MPERVRLLGIPLDPVTAPAAVERLLTLLTAPGQHHAATPNPEMLLAAARNRSFHALLNRTALNLPDGVGLLRMAARTGQHLPERVTGIDTVTALCQRLNSQHSVFLLGARTGIAERAAATLKRLNPQLVIAGTFAGSPDTAAAPAIVERINASGADVLFVAYGAPAQEQWIDTYLPQMPAVKLAMGVGGTFDFLAGTAKRAPPLFQKLGIEWLWRLIRQPSRLPRIWNATVVFPRLVGTFRRESPFSSI